MERIKPNTNCNFVRFAKTAVIISLLVVIGILSFVYRGGPNYGIDFVGGTVVHVKFTQPMAIADIRQTLASTDIANVAAQDFGQGGGEFLIRMPVAEAGDENIAANVQKGLVGKFGEQAFAVRRIETVGPKVGKDLRQRAILDVASPIVPWVDKGGQKA